MADMTLCSGEACDLRHNCRRYLTTPAPLQSWLSEVPMVDGRCELYLPLNGRKTE